MMTEKDWEDWLRAELRALGIVAIGIPMMATHLANKVDAIIDEVGGW